MPIQNLTLEDIELSSFNKNDSSGRKVLALKNIPGFTLLVGYAGTNGACKICDIIVPILQQKIAPQFNNCTFAFIDVMKQNFSLVRLSKQTVMPIQFTPFIIFYINGRPILKYDGKAADVNEITNFVISSIKKYSHILPDMSMKRHSNQSNQSNHSNQSDGFLTKDEDEEVPGYSIGVPYNIICDKDDLCYLTESELMRPKVEAH